MPCADSRGMLRRIVCVCARERLRAAPVVLDVHGVHTLLVRPADRHRSRLPALRRGHFASSASKFVIALRYWAFSTGHAQGYAPNRWINREEDVSFCMKGGEMRGPYARATAARLSQKRSLAFVDLFCALPMSCCQGSQKVPINSGKVQCPDRQRSIIKNSEASPAATL
jgi:hypothetical protein